MTLPGGSDRGHRGRPIRRWRVMPLRKLVADVAAFCPDPRCGMYSKPVAHGDGRCATCRATLTVQKPEVKPCR